MLQSVQILRGIAAMGVVVFHTNLIFGQYGGPVLFPGVFDYGQLGVHLFFILSGFIILKAHEADLGNPASAPRYIYRRIARIYPIYWIYTTAYIGAAFAGFGSPDFSWRPIDLAASYTLLSLTLEFIQPPLKVAWTLLYEVKFYLLFAIALYSPRWALQLCIAWVLAISFAAYLGWVDSLNFLSPWNLFFVAGLTVYWASKRISATWWPAIAFTGIVLFAIYATSSQLNKISTGGNDVVTLYWFVAVFACALLSVVLADSRSKKAPKLLLLLGDASYSLYLTHSAVISASAIFCRKLNLFSSNYAVALNVLTVLASMLFGVIAYLMVERPLLVYLRRYTPQLRTPATPTGPGYARRGI